MDAMGALIWLANEREQGRAGDVDEVIQARSVCKNQQQMGSTGNRSFCISFLSSTTSTYSWRADPEAVATDAFMQRWTGVKAFAHPPWCLLQKVMLERATLVLITPLWCSSHHYGELNRGFW